MICLNAEVVYGIYYLFYLRTVHCRVTWQAQLFVVYALRYWQFKVSELLQCLLPVRRYGVVDKGLYAVS